MSVALSKKGPVLASDANAALINLYLAVQQGWDPPDCVSESCYESAKKLPDTDPMRGYAGWCAAFGGKFFGGYARGEGRNWAAEGKRALLRDISQVRRIQQIDFLAETPRPISAVIYADPPYANTTGYSTGAFDSAAFCAKVCDWAAFAHVFVSEYSLPVGRCVWEQPLTVRAGVGPGKTQTERLYYLPKGSLW